MLVDYFKQPQFLRPIIFCGTSDYVATSGADQSMRPGGTCLVMLSKTMRRACMPTGWELLAPTIAFECFFLELIPLFM
eukprot:6487113-Amphidinium_carterae.1